MPHSLVRTLKFCFACCSYESCAGIREFAVSPILVSMLDTPQYKRRRLELEGRNRLEAPHTHRLTWSDMRMHNLLDSTISGALTGGILYSYQRM